MEHERRCCASRSCSRSPWWRPPSLRGIVEVIWCTATAQLRRPDRDRIWSLNPLMFVRVWGSRASTGERPNNRGGEAERFCEIHHNCVGHGGTLLTMPRVWSGPYDRQLTFRVERVGEAS